MNNANLDVQVQDIDRLGTVASIMDEIDLVGGSGTPIGMHPQQVRWIFLQTAIMEGWANAIQRLISAFTRNIAVVNCLEYALYSLRINPIRNEAEFFYQLFS